MRCRTKGRATFQQRLNARSPEQRACQPSNNCRSTKAFLASSPRVCCVSSFIFYSECGKERRLGNAGAIGPAVGGAGHAADFLPPCAGFSGNAAVAFLIGQPVHDELHQRMNLLAAGPEVDQVHIPAAAALPHRFATQVAAPCRQSPRPPPAAGSIELACFARGSFESLERGGKGVGRGTLLGGISARNLAIGLNPSMRPWFSLCANAQTVHLKPGSIAKIK